MNEIVSKITIWAIAIGTFSLFQAVPSPAANPDRPTTPAIGRGNTPTSGKVVKFTHGDLMCYVDLIDARGKKHNIGADFAICDRPKFLNKQVRLTYKRIQVNDCQSNEPCGKTRLKNAIVKMRLMGLNR